MADSIFVIRNRYILGDTLAAYIFAYYNPKYKVIAVKPSIKDDIIYSSASMKDFFRDIGVSFTEKIQKCAIKHDNKIIDTFSTDLIKLYAQNSRVWSRLDDEDCIGLVCSTRKTLVFDRFQLIRKLSRKVTVIDEDKIESIDLDRRYIIGSKDIYYYSHLVSTIPQSQLAWLCDIFPILSYSGYTDILVKSKSILLPKDIDILYMTKGKCHRIEMGNKPGYYILRYSGSVTKKMFLEDLKIEGKVHISGIRREGQGYCYGKSIDFSSKRLILAGKYAEWSPFSSNNSVLKFAYRKLSKF